MTVAGKEVGRELMAAVSRTPGGTLLSIEVQPGSSRPGRLFYDEWRKRIKLTVRERAENGRANAELLSTLSSALCVPARSMGITSGPTDRRKSVRVDGLSPSEVLERLLAHLKGE